MERRRRVSRQSAGWAGRCHIDGESAVRWHHCRVIDISILGLGITFRHQSPSELLGRALHVEVPAVGDSVKVQFDGEIRSATPENPEGSVRVGIEFVGLSEAEQAITACLSALSRRVTRLSMA